MHFGLLTRYLVTFLNLLINSNNLALFLCMSYVHNPNYIQQHGSIIYFQLLYFNYFFLPHCFSENLLGQCFNRKDVVSMPCCSNIREYMYHIFLSIHLLMDIQVASSLVFTNDAAKNTFEHASMYACISLVRFLNLSIIDAFGQMIIWCRGVV